VEEVALAWLEVWATWEVFTVGAVEVEVTVAFFSVLPFTHPLLIPPAQWGK